jgi:hypothetical protein
LCQNAVKSLIKFSQRTLEIYLFSFSVWEPSMGSSHKLQYRYRDNAYTNRYPNNNPIIRISMVTINRNNSCNVASGVYTLDINRDIWKADPSCRQRRRPQDTRPQISDSNIPTGNNIWSQFSQEYSAPRHTD